MSGQMLDSVPEMDDRQFAQWQTLLERRIGVWLPSHRKLFLLSGLLTRMREIGETDYRGYYRRLVAGSKSEYEWAQLIDCLTVHETRFFRDPDSLALVESFCAERLQTRKGKSLELWSVGCASGEEAYTLALLMHKLRDERGHFYYGVTGVDVSFPALAMAREGIYHRRKLETVPEALRKQCFDARGDDYFQVSAEVRARVLFVQGNLIDSRPVPEHHYDVIYCQNVLIYFQPDRRQQILTILADRLAPGGLLVLAPGEMMDWQPPQLQRVNHPHCLAFTRRQD